jgi:hypothetical protein
MNFREIHTRKTSRKKVNSDIFDCILLFSDPLINAIRGVKTKTGKLLQ